VEHVTIWDSLDKDGRPGFTPDHPRLADGDRQSVARYLEGGSIVAGTDLLEPDILAPAGGDPVVPQHVRTDGRWVWSDEVTYYVRQHGLAPHQPFMDYLRERNFRRGRRPSATRIQEAYAAVFVPTEPGRE